MRRLILLAACAAAAAAVWFVFFSGRIAWNEEVLLQSGERLMTHRTAITRPFGEIGGPGGWENKGMTLEITAPAKPDNPKRWRAKFVPLLFDRDPDNAEWFIVATFVSCTSWYELGRPGLPYTEFRYRNGQWVQQRLSDKFIGREGNMFTDISSRGEPDHTVEDKQGRMNDPTILHEYKRIVTTWSTNC